MALLEQLRRQALQAGFEAGQEHGRREGALAAAEALLDEAQEREAAAYQRGWFHGHAARHERQDAMQDGPSVAVLLAALRSGKHGPPTQETEP